MRWPSYLGILKSRVLPGDQHRRVGRLPNLHSASLLKEVRT